MTVRNGRSIEESFPQKGEIVRRQILMIGFQRRHDERIALDKQGIGRSDDPFPRQPKVFEGRTLISAIRVVDDDVIESSEVVTGATHESDSREQIDQPMVKIIGRLRSDEVERATCKATRCGQVQARPDGVLRSTCRIVRERGGEMSLRGEDAARPMTPCDAVA